MEYFDPKVLCPLEEESESDSETFEEDNISTYQKGEEASKKNQTQRPNGKHSQSKKQKNSSNVQKLQFQGQASSASSQSQSTIQVQVKVLT